MSIDEAINRACADVGIIPPKGLAYGKWMQTDTLAGRNGKGDGRVIVNEASVCAYNWQTGQNATIWLNDGHSTVSDRKRIAHAIQYEKEKKRERAARAASIAAQIVEQAATSGHPYLTGKGFTAEKTLTVEADVVRRVAGDYLVPDSGKRAIVMPARIDGRITSLQLIWEDGTKKFLASGEIGGSSHRIAKGADTWLCEGLATGLTVRAALKSLRVSATVLCCFSASNIAVVAKSIRTRCFIAADHDSPLEQFGGLGAGEYFARQTGIPYGMPPDVKTDFNDMHQRAGIFAVQRVLTSIMARRRT